LDLAEENSKLRSHSSALQRNLNIERRFTSRLRPPILDGSPALITAQQIVKARGRRVPLSNREKKNEYPGICKKELEGSSRSVSTDGRASCRWGGSNSPRRDIRRVQVRSTTSTAGDISKPAQQSNRREEQPRSNKSSPQELAKENKKKGTETCVKNLGGKSGQPDVANRSKRDAMWGDRFHSPRTGTPAGNTEITSPG